MLIKPERGLINKYGASKHRVTISIPKETGFDISDFIEIVQEKANELIIRKIPINKCLS